MTEWPEKSGKILINPEADKLWQQMEAAAVRCAMMPKWLTRIGSDGETPRKEGPDD